MEYAAIFRQLPIPLAIVDQELVVQDASEAYALLSGSVLSDVIGRPLSIAFNGRVAADISAVVAERAEFETIGTLSDAEFRIHIASCGLSAHEPARAFVILTPSGVGDSRAMLGELHESVRHIRHEINNPLTGALGNINLLLRQANLDEKTRHRLTTAEHEIKKVSLLVLKLGDLAPRETADLVDP